MLGDVLWAMMVTVGFSVLLFKYKAETWLMTSLLFCYLIELSQLYHADWIDTIRQSFIGGLVLGFGFLWTDILAYTIGVCLAGFILKLRVFKQP